MVILEIVLASISFLLILSFLVACFIRTRNKSDLSASIRSYEDHKNEEIVEEDLITFLGGENLTIYDILDAPGEVIAKSSYGTIYKARLEKNSVKVIRFMRPVCTESTREVISMVRFLGLVRHSNLVPIQAFYVGSRGEQLLVQPFYRHGNLMQFIEDKKKQSHNWDTICSISIGITRGLDHLHTGLHKPLIHGNLKSKNVFLDRNFQPHISDFGMYHLMNPSAAYEMLETYAFDGYKAPELKKPSEVTLETDVYSLGVILLELLTGKEPVSRHVSPVPDFFLPDKMRNAILNHRITDLIRPDMIENGHEKYSGIPEESFLKYFRIAMACCSPSPTVRPGIKQILCRLQDICFSVNYRTA